MLFPTDQYVLATLSNVLYLNSELVASCVVDVSVYVPLPYACPDNVVESPVKAAGGYSALGEPIAASGLPAWSLIVGVPLYTPEMYMLPDESHATPNPWSALVESIIREYWYVPEESNLDTNAACPPELAGKISTVPPNCVNILGVAL